MATPTEFHCAVQIPLLNRLIQHPDGKVKEYVLRALRPLTDDDSPIKYRIQSVLESVVMRHVVDLMNPGDDGGFCWRSLEVVSLHSHTLYWSLISPLHGMQLRVLVCTSVPLIRARVLS